MGQQVSVETFVSSKDAEGNKYWTSFDPYPFKVGSRKLVYMGILNGDGPLSGQKCVVKTVRNGAITRQDWMLESKRAKVARYLAREYNKIVPNEERKITFNCPIMAEIDTMSDCLCINDILGKPKKKWEDCESVSIELYLKGKFEDFEYGWVNLEDLLLPEAFSHFTWCRSEGQMLVSNLQGVKTRVAYHFTGPTIHSESGEFGSSDQGAEGFKSFFRLHQCNAICKNWPRLGDGIDLRGWGEYIATDSRFPSAPPPPLTGFVTPPPYKEVPEPYDERMDERGSERIRSRRPTDSSEIFPWNDRGRADQNCRQDLITQRHQEQRSPNWTHQNGRGFVLDWREEFMNQSMMYGPRYGNDNPVFQDAFGMQLMWIVKQMSYAVYAQPPPPYCAGALNNDSNAHLSVYNSRHENEHDGYYHEESDKKYLLPPPAYSEENVDPRCEFVTYV